jgi:cytochrome c peroxidase
MKPETLAGWLSAAMLVFFWYSGAAHADTPYVWNLPIGFPTPKVPTDNPLTVEKAELGRLLFYDTRLSANQTQACASCHQQKLAFTDGRARGLGSTGELHPRGPMSLTNVAYNSVYTWANPVLPTLEKQILVPMLGQTPVELGLTGHQDELFARLKADARYRRMFREAFPDRRVPVSLNSIVQSITSFVRTLISGNSPYDRYTNGADDFALSASAQRGARLFFSERLQCFHCHGGFNFSASTTFAGKAFDEVQFDNNGLYNIDGTGAYPQENMGIFAFTRIPSDMGRFKAPTLRNIELTAPYMHDGSIPTLQGVIDHYAAGGRTITDGPTAGDGSKNRFKSGFLKGFTLTDQENQDVMALLESLTDTEFVNNPRFGDPFAPVVCPGDCNHDGTASVDELITAVGIAGNTDSLATCIDADTSGDGTVGVDELVAAVRAALNGCPAVAPTVRPSSRPAQPFAYVLEPEGAAAVDAVNLGTHAVKVIVVGTYAWAGAVSPDNALFLVRAGDESRIGAPPAFKLAVIDTASRSIRTTIPVHKAGGVAVAGSGLAYFTDCDPDGVVRIVDPATGAQVAQVPLDVNPKNIWLTPNGALAYVTDGGYCSGADVTDNNIAVVDTALRKEVAKIVLDGVPGNIAIAPAGDVLYVTKTGYAGTSIAVISTATNQVIAEIPLSNPGDIAVTPDGRRLYAVNFPSGGAGNVAVIDTGSKQTVGTIAFSSSDSPAGLAIHPNGRRAYVTHRNDNGAYIAEVDTASDAVVDNIPIPGVGRIFIVDPRRGAGNADGRPGERDGQKPAGAR